MKVSKSVRFAAQGDADWQDRWPDWLLNLWPAGALQRLLCLVGGHVPMADQCGIPDHDYCAWCQKSMPGQAPGRRRSEGAAQ